MLKCIIAWVLVYFVLIETVTIIIKIGSKHSKINKLKINYISKLDDSRNKESENWVKYLELRNSIQNNLK